MIKLRSAKQCSPARESASLEDQIERFLQLYEQKLGQHNFLPEYLINIDETKASPSKTSSSSRRFGRAGKTELHTVEDSDDACRTLIVCASASGKTYMTIKLFSENGLA
jgi:hypothetical protein